LGAVRKWREHLLARLCRLRLSRSTAAFPEQADPRAPKLRSWSWCSSLTSDSGPLPGDHWGGKVRPLSGPQPVACRLATGPSPRSRGQRQPQPSLPAPPSGGAGTRLGTSPMPEPWTSGCPANPQDGGEKPIKRRPPPLSPEDGLRQPWPSYDGSWRAPPSETALPWSASSVARDRSSGQARAAPRHNSVPPLDSPA
jgi:hypothetical protein